MRLFAGIPLPQPALGDVQQILAGLQSREWPVRWVRPEGLHLTLKFYGSVEEAKVDELAAALTSAAEGTGPIPMTCTGLGTFPSGTRAKVIWAGVEAPGTLELLQDSVERASAALGFPLEGRPYHPHITLGRVNEGGRLPPDALAGASDEFEISFLAERVVLFQSRPGPGGSIYSVHHTIPLSPCAVA